MKFKFAVILALCLSASAFVSPNAEAAYMAYHFSGTGSGSLNGVNFTSKAYTLTAFADSENIVEISPGRYQLIADHVDFNVATVGSGRLSDEMALHTYRTDSNEVGHINLTYGPSRDPGSSGIYFDSRFDGFPTYSLANTMPSTRPDGVSAMIQETTAGGTLNISSVSEFDSTARFSANTVPEPSTWALVAVTLVGFALLRRRAARA